jgi:hypothetical protein
VINGNVTVVQPDIIIANGVVHIIDQVRTSSHTNRSDYLMSCLALDSTVVHYALSNSYLHWSSRTLSTTKVP